jgi:hypothetical protein
VSALSPTHSPTRHKSSLRQFSQSIPAFYHNLAGRLDGHFEAGVIRSDLRWLTQHESCLGVWKQLEFNFISRSNTKVLEKIFRQGDPSPRSDCQFPHANAILFQRRPIFFTATSVAS